MGAIIREPLPGLENRDFSQVAGVYQRDRRPLEPSVVDSLGRMVRAVGMTQTFLSSTQVDELVALYDAGATLVKLGERFGVHRRTAAAHLVRRSVPIRRRGLDECHLPEAVELYAGGLTLMEFGLRFGVSQQAVRRALAAKGVEIRSSRRRQLAVNQSARSAP